LVGEKKTVKGEWKIGKSKGRTLRLLGEAGGKKKGGWKKKKTKNAKKKGPALPMAETMGKYSESAEKDKIF